MTVSLERLFVKYVLRNKKFFEVVNPSFFKNPDIEFVYSVIKKWMIKHPEVDVPSGKQLFEMVHLEDKEGKITPEIFKAVFSSELSEYDEESFIIPKFNTWILINRIKEGTFSIIDETRSIENVTEYDQAIQVVNKLKEIVDTSTRLDFEQNEDLGSDFDDAEAHSQDHSQVKVKSGFPTLDHILGGGWDVGTLNILMAQTNGGKSLWMQNFAVMASNIGYNVLYITLEMSEKKVLKRLGSMRLKIPINEYDKVSLDKDFMAAKIRNIYNNTTDLFDSKPGKLITKFYAAGTTTIQHFDKLIEDIQLKRGIKFNMLVVDYVTLIAPPKGLGIDNNLYMKGKHLAEGLRALAAKYNVPLITAMQVAKDAWSSNDITLESIPESKAIAETADTFFGIIRTEEMKRLNKYRLKLLKQRDGDFSRSLIAFDLNVNYLTLENDMFLDTV